MSFEDYLNEQTPIKQRELLLTRIDLLRNELLEVLAATEDSQAIQRIEKALSHDEKLGGLNLLMFNPELNFTKYKEC